MNYHVIDRQSCINVFVDLNMHDAIGLADWLVRCKYEVTEVRVQVASQQTLLIIEPAPLDKLNESLQFYFDNMP